MQPNPKRMGTKKFIQTRTNQKTRSQKQQIISNLNKNNYAKLILLDETKLVGFISLFPSDGEERKDLTSWYATMYVKKNIEATQKILNDAILKETKNRGFDKVYLNSDLVNYYEKFKAKYIQDLSNGEKLYYIKL